MARTGLDRWTPHATWTAVIASNLPDIDIVAQFAGNAIWVDYHRGVTHTIVGIPILSLLLAVTMSTLSRARPRVESFKKHFAVALIVMPTHLILDWANTYGVRPFLPFNRHWYYGDTLFAVDFYLDLILLAGVITCHHASARRTSIAFATLASAMAYIGMILASRSVAQNQLANYTASRPEVVASSIGPRFMDPFGWVGFLETDDDISTVRIDVLKDTIQKRDRMEKAPSSPVTEAADKTYSASVFRGYARYLATHVERRGADYRVLFIDFKTALSAEVLLDDKLRVLRESLKFVGPFD
jgi:inner membrane protein